MIDLDSFKKLKPNSNNMVVESFEEALPKFKEVLPNFPECVLEQWTYRHFDNFCSDYWWLDFTELKFERVLFDREKIMEINSKIPDTLNFWGDDFINRPEYRAKNTWLGKYMMENRKWPKPIIVFDTNNNTAELEHELLKPYHLLEGHFRLAYMQALIRYSIDNVQTLHEIWLVHK